MALESHVKRSEGEGNPKPQEHLHSLDADATACSTPSNTTSAHYTIGKENVPQDTARTGDPWPRDPVARAAMLDYEQEGPHGPSAERESKRGEETRSSFDMAGPSSDSDALVPLEEMSSRSGDGHLVARNQHGFSNCQRSCCPKVPVPLNDSLLRLNAHCAFSGHCVQLKHTFIHVECSPWSDEEDNCAICKLSRSRSSDNIELSLDRAPPSPLLSPETQLRRDARREARRRSSTPQHHTGEV